LKKFGVGGDVKAGWKKKKKRKKAKELSLKSGEKFSGSDNEKIQGKATTNCHEKN